mgnify:CR=1 FL=1
MMSYVDEVIDLVVKKNPAEPELFCRHMHYRKRYSRCIPRMKLS